MSEPKFFELRMFNEQKVQTSSTGIVTLGEMSAAGWDVCQVLESDEKFYIVHVPEVGKPEVLEFGLHQEMMKKLQTMLPTEDVLMLFKGVSLKISEPTLSVSVELKSGHTMSIPVGKKEEPKEEPKAEPAVPPEKEAPKVAPKAAEKPAEGKPDGA